MAETPDADRLAAMSDAELIQAAVDSQEAAWTSVHVSQVEQRLAELERKVNHAELPETVVAWFAELAKYGAVTGRYSIPCASNYGPTLSWAIYPDGKMWLEICDVSMCTIWRQMLTPPGKVPGG